MGRDWRRLALAALAAAVLGSVCGTVGGLNAPAQAQQKAAKKAPAKSEPAAKQESAEADDDQDDNTEKPKAPAKKKKQDPAEAQRAIDAATKQLQAGKMDQAIQTLTAVLAGGNLPPALMAKALHGRGIAHRQQNKQAQAISDLTSALWIKGGLSEADRADALGQRAAAYREAGLGDNGEVQSAGGAASAPRQKGSESATASEAVPKASGGGGWNLFGNIFGGGTAQPTAPAPATTASVEKPERTTPEPRAKATSAWVGNTQVHSDGETAPTHRASAAQVAAVPKSKPDGRFRVQFGMTRTQDQAQAIAAKLKRDYGPALEARDPEIDQAVVGNMGSFYRVRVGPFATQQEALGICAKVKGSGLDCLAVTQ